MKYIYLVLNWIFGIIFLLCACLVASSPLASLCFFAISVLLLPPVRNIIYSKINKEITTKTRAIFILVLLVSASILNTQSMLSQQKEIEKKQAQEQAQKAEILRQEIIQDFQANRKVILASIEECITAKDFKSAISKIDKYIISGDEEINALRAQAVRGIQSIQRAKKTEKLLEELKTIAADDNHKNRDIYQQLLSINPENELYKSKESFYAKKIQEAERVEKAQEEKRIASALQKMSKKTDKIEGIDWYRDKSSPIYTNMNGFYIYIGDREIKSWLRLRIQYHADDWLFIESFIVVADGQRFDSGATEFKRDHDGTIWEWYDENLSASDLQMIKAIIASKEAVIRFNGHNNYRKDVKITAAQKTALQNVLDAYAALGGI